MMGNSSVGICKDWDVGHGKRENNSSFKTLNLLKVNGYLTLIICEIEWKTQFSLLSVVYVLRF